MAAADRSAHPRVMHVITNFESRGGAETMLGRLVRSMPPVPTTVVSLRDVSSRCHTMLPPWASEPIPLRMRRPADLVRGVRNLARLIEHESPDTLVGWMYHADAALVGGARLARSQAKLVWTVHHGLDDLPSESRSTRAAIAACRWLSPAVDDIIYVSSASQVQHRRRKFRPERDHVIPNGIEVPAKAPELRPPPTVVGMVARFHPSKDYNTFIAATRLVMAADPSIRIKIAGAGAGADNPVLTGLCEQHQLDMHRVELLGFVDDTDTLYESIDVLVLSSRTEALGNVLLEGMAHGVPCVATSVGRCRRSHRTRRHARPAACAPPTCSPAKHSRS